MIKKMLWKDAQQILTNKDITYLWFGTDWCGDCQMMEPVIEDLVNNNTNDENIQFIKVDAEEAELFRVESKWQVKKIPTHVFLKKGEIKNILYEYIPEEILQEEIDKLKNE